MRVALVMHHLGVGGAQRQMVELAKGLGRRGHDVRVVTLFPGGPGWSELESDARVGIESLYRAPARNRPGSLAKLAAAGALLRARLQRWQADVVYSALYSNNIVARMASVGARWALAWGVRSSGESLSWNQATLMRAAAPLSLGVALLIANSEVGLRVHQRAGYRASRNVTIPNGIDTERFKRDPDARERLRKEWKIGAEERAVGIVARLTPVKDHPTFLRAAKLMLEARSDLKFVCVGDGRSHHRARLVRQAADLGLEGHLVWAGERADMPMVYSALDLSVLSSVVEGFPNAIGEAMACEVPCVGTNVGDTAVLMGSIGRVAQPGDPVALAQAMTAVLDTASSDRDLGRQARRRVLDNFSAPMMVTRTEQELARLTAATE